MVSKEQRRLPSTVSSLDCRHSRGGNLNSSNGISSVQNGNLVAGDQLLSVDGRSLIGLNQER